MEYDSPSRQLLEEYARYKLESDRSFRARLDEAALELELQHNAAIRAARVQHDEVLRGAEEVRAMLHLQIENEKLRRIREDQERMEQLREDNARLARETQMEEHKKREHAQRIQLEEERQRVQSQARMEEEERNHNMMLQQQEEHARKAREESEAKLVAAAEAAKAAKTAIPTTLLPVPSFATTSAQVPGASKPSVQPLQSTPTMDWSLLEQDHNDYLTLHKKLKEFRSYMNKTYKLANETQKKTGRPNPIRDLQELRRALAKAMGQTTMDKQRNKVIRTDVRTIMTKAWNNTSVPIDAKTFIIKPITPFADGQNTQVSGVFVFLLNILIKAAIKSMPSSATTTTYNALDPIGVLICWITSLNEFRLQGNPFTDIILAKYHKVAPILFGIHGSEKTQSGRERLGWAKEDGEWADIQTHYDRLNGLSIGWAAITLRDFSKVAETSAFPHWMYWKTLAGIINLPPGQLSRSHSVALRGLLNLYGDKFVKSYGKYAIMVLRKTLIDIPAQAPKDADASILTVIKDNLGSKHNIRI